MLTIQNDRLYRGGVPVTFVPTPNQGGRILPTIICLHDTAGGLTKGSTVSWFTNPKAKVSAHFVVERDGTITQMVECDRAAWHAGKSSWKGRSGCNSFSIGIEIVNPGKLTLDGTAWFGERFQGVQECTTKEHGRGCWLPYTKEQIEAVTAICKALVDAYPIKEIVTHWMISPGRKVDCTPLLPLEEIRKEVFVRTVPSEWPLQIGSEGENVKLAQARLKELGFTQVGKVDGIFGPQTRAAVLAWEAENGAATDGRIDRAEFDALMSPDAKPMAVGAATQKEQRAKESSATAIEATAATGAAVIAGDAAADVMDAPSLWDTLMHTLGLAGDAVSKVTILGVQIDQRLALAGLGTVALIAVWRWARIARG